jgi:hypothetical protein
MTELTDEMEECRYHTTDLRLDPGSLSDFALGLLVGVGVGVVASISKLPETQDGEAGCQ